MTTRMNWIYAAVFAMALSLAPGRAHAQAACVDINSPAGIAVTAINQQLNQIGQRIQSLGPLLSQGQLSLGQLAFVGMTVAQIANDLLQLRFTVQQMANELGPDAAGAITNAINIGSAVIGNLNNIIGALINIIGGLGGLGAIAPNPVADILTQVNAVIQNIASAVPTICE